MPRGIKGAKAGDKKGLNRGQGKGLLREDGFIVIDHHRSRIGGRGDVIEEIMLWIPPQEKIENDEEDEVGDFRIPREWNRS